MKAILAVLLSIALCCCHSKKDIACQESTLMNEQVIADSVAKGQTDLQLINRILAICDSLKISFSADSIATDKAVIYRPSIAIEASEPYFAKENSCNLNMADSASLHVAEKNEVATNSYHTNKSETVATAKPLSLTWIAIITIVSVVILTLCYIKTHK